MAEPTAQEIVLAIGQSKAITVTMDEAPAGGVALWTVRFRMRKKGSATVAVTKTLAAGVVITNATTGVWTITLKGSDTTGLDPEQYEWSFWRTDTDSEAPIAFGTITPYVTAEVG